MKSIGESVFSGCSGLTNITIPNSVTSIGETSFYGCSGLASIDIPNSVTSIGSRAFYNCSALTSITIPNSVKSIEDETFYNCSNLTSITIPNSVTSIGGRAFQRCSGLTSITIPNSVTSIRSTTFENCSGLTNITIPNSVAYIEAGAFVGCSGLTSIIIPNSVRYIEGDAFGYCSSLKSVRCSSLIPPVCHEQAFRRVTVAECTLEIPEEAIDAYTAVAPWNSFNIVGVREPSEITIIDGEAYEIVENEEFNRIAYTRTLNNTEWNALYLPFEIPVTAEFLEDYDVAYFNDIHSFDNYIGDKEDGVLGADGVIDRMEMEVLTVQEGAVLNANYPYLIRAKNENALNMNIVVENATLYKAVETTVSCSSVFMRFDVTGIYTTQTSGELKGEFNVYAMSGGGWKQALNDAQQLKPFRLYLKLTSIEGSPVKVAESAMSNIRIRLDGEGEATGIERTQITVGKPDQIYDLQGRRVEKAEKGIYIINGKKVVIK